MKKVFLGIFIAVCLYGMVVAFGNSAGSYNATQASEATAKQEFMSGCDDGSLDGARFDQTNYCECVYNSAKTEFGLKQMANDSLNLTESEMTEKYKSNALECVNKQI